MTNSKPLLADYLTHMAGALWYQWHHTLANNCNWNAWWTRGYPTPSADASCPGRPPARHRRVWSSPGEERGAGCSNVGPSSSLTSWGQLGRGAGGRLPPPLTFSQYVSLDIYIAWDQNRFPPKVATCLATMTNSHTKNHFDKTRIRFAVPVFTYCYNAVCTTSTYTWAQV